MVSFQDFSKKTVLISSVIRKIFFGGGNLLSIK